MKVSAATPPPPGYRPTYRVEVVRLPAPQPPKLSPEDEKLVDDFMQEYERKLKKKTNPFTTGT